MPHDSGRQECLTTPHEVTINLPGSEKAPLRPSVVTHLSSPTYVSPLRHHRRKPSTPRQVKETLHARSEYTNSEDDGSAIHRINQYVIKQEIGRGSFGAVHRAVDQHGTEFAVKEFSKSRLRKRAQSNILRQPHGVRRPRQHLGAGLGFNSPMHWHAGSGSQASGEDDNPLYLIREEIAIMKKLNHHNLVSLYEVLDDPTEDSVYMVLEMCKKGVVMKVGMNERADPYDTENCRCWFRDLILGIEYLHAQGVVHRDIKPDNLLLTEDDVLKIVDFGVSEMFEKSSDMTTAKSAGSPAFLPPELCVSRHGGISGKAADIWSMGVTLYCLYYGKVPFEKTAVLELYESIKNDDPDVGDCDDDFADLIRKLLDKDPAKRIQMPELREHPWVTKRGTDPLLPTEENTSDLVEPPTEEEMNRAITGNLSNLLVVMKAVKKFKGLITKGRPYMLDSILGQNARMVQPPLSMERPSANPLHSKARSEDIHDRRLVEGALVREGVHRKIGPKRIDTDPRENDNDTVMTETVHASTDDRRQGSSSVPSLSSRGHSEANYRLDSLLEHKLVGKGQAHNPLEEFLFLEVGPGGGSEAPDPPVVSESPPAAEGNIYEIAYHEEVERIRSNSKNATLYLTRRVDQTQEYQEDERMIGVDKDQAEAPSGFAKVLEKARDKGADAKERGEQQASRLTSDLFHKVTSRTLGDS